MKALPAMLAVGLAAGLAGCVAPAQTYQPPRVAQMGVTMTGAQEMPPTTSMASGVGAIAVDRATNQMTYNVNYAGLTGPLQQVALVGPSGAGDIIQLALPVQHSPLAGSAYLTPAQTADLIAGRYAMELRTPAFPNGEIRGPVLLGAPVAAVAPVPAPVIATVPPPAVYPPGATVVPVQPGQTIVIQPR